MQDPEARAPLRASAVTLAVLVAALGYFVDIYDLVLFAILRTSSLKSLGLAPEQITSQGAFLLNIQLTGMIVGGIAWGVLGDRRGRLTVLFGSIILYSIANLANAFVVDVPQYAVVRFLAGFGLAGELGAGITLVSELLDRRVRGIGTTIVATVGLAGAVFAGLIGEKLIAWDAMKGWRVAYGVGGGMGLLLLALRIGVLESGLFKTSLQAEVSRGNILMLLCPAERFLRFLRVVLVGMPIWFAGGILFVFAPEVGGAMGLDPRPTGGNTIFWAYTGVVMGDLASGLLSQVLGRRKLVVALFLVLFAGATTLLLLAGGRSLVAFYGLMCLLGATTGYWVLFVTMASEQFGTNLRSTVTTSAPNFVRGSAVVITQVWVLAKGPMGVVPATLSIGLTCIAIGLLALASLPETFDRDLDYFER